MLHGKMSLSGCSFSLVCVSCKMLILLQGKYVSHRANIQSVLTSSFWIQYADLPQVLLGSLQHASCVIQPTKLPFSTDELFDMAHHCGLNRLNQFAAFLSSHFRNCRLNPKAVAMLASFDEVLYGGQALPVEDQDWAYRNGIRLRVRSAPVSRVIASF